MMRGLIAPEAKVYATSFVRSRWKEMGKENDLVVDLVPDCALELVMVSWIARKIA